MQHSHTDSDRHATNGGSEDDVHVVNYYETSDIELSVTVVHAVLEVTGKEPTDVNLNAVVQPDALNRIFSPKRDGTPREGGVLEFDLAGCRVTIHGSGEVRVDPTPE
jgi:hypothetical protein